MDWTNFPKYNIFIISSAPISRIDTKIRMRIFDFAENKWHIATLHKPSFATRGICKRRSRSWLK